ncbi:hypothetical protein XELAEV_18031094mg [Xenopus laevis]|uniref:Uncharacterized protein n=1 Tax=Xenopus laevis TaxID=8355 RepID=A0A974CM17_XENLA|nr:hypothetical protein XELAEV_18031094mg [Xenopus laevis]
MRCKNRNTYACVLWIYLMNASSDNNTATHIFLSMFSFHAFFHQLHMKIRRVKKILSIHIQKSNTKL